MTRALSTYRLIDLETIRHLSLLLEGLAGQARSIAGSLAALNDSQSVVMYRLGSWADGSAGLVATKVAAAQPGPSWGAGKQRFLQGALGAIPPATALEALNESSKTRAWDELWLVVAELNRFSAMGMHSGPVFTGLLKDYNTLVRLLGTNLVYFNVDTTVPIGSRSSRAGYRAGVWIGPADADHVLVMIPGMNTTTAGWLDDNLPDADRLREQAAELAENHGAGEVAVVPLLSYAPPQSFLDAALGHFWKDGSKETAGVLESLPLDGRHVTGWGHSYGAAVLGATAATGAEFDDLIMVGGAGTGTETLAELGITSDHFFVATNWNDPIRLVPNEYHGVSPATLPHVPVPTAPVTDFDPWKAVLSVPWFLIDGLPDHDYLEDETATRAFAAITIGLDDLED